MSPNELVEVFQKYGLISGSESDKEDALDLIDEDLEVSINALDCSRSMQQTDRFGSR